MNNSYILNDSFVDFLGNEHKFTVAAVLEPAPDMIITDGELSFSTPCVARLSLGVAVCNNADEWDEKKGAKIAEGRARKFVDHNLVITSKAMLSMLNDEAINDLLDREAGYVKEHIGAFIPGYEGMRKKHEKAEAEKALFESLPESEQQLLNNVNNLSVPCKEFLSRVLNNY